MKRLIIFLFCLYSGLIAIKFSVFDCIQANTCSPMENATFIIVFVITIVTCMLAAFATKGAIDLIWSKWFWCIGLYAVFVCMVALIVLSFKVATDTSLFLIPIPFILIIAAYTSFFSLVEYILEIKFTTKEFK